MKSQIHDVDGRRVKVYRAPADGPAIVLIHGANGSGATWPAVAEAWGWANVWAPSMPGRDGSDPIDHDRVDALADWLWRFVEAEVERPVWLVGHSLGGAVALTLGLRAPGALAGLAMVSSSARLKVAPAILELAAASSPEAPMDIDMAFGPGTPPEVAARYKREAAGLPTASSVGDWRACDAFDRRADLGHLNLPLLAVWGSEDALTIPKHQRWLVNAVPGAEGHEMPGGHMLPWEQPRAVADRVRAFITTRL